MKHKTTKYTLENSGSEMVMELPEIQTKWVNEIKTLAIQLLKL